MANQLYHPLNPGQNKPWDDAATYWVLRGVNESPAQVEERFTANVNNALRYTWAQLLGLGTLISNPNVAPQTGSGLPVPGPSWLNLRYTYNTGTKRLDVEQGGDEVQLRFARKSGVAFAGSNPDGVALQSGTFYDAGPLANQGSFVRQWAFGTSAAAGSGVPAELLLLTVKKVDGTLFSVEFTPVDGVRQPLVVAGTGSSLIGADWMEDTSGGDSFVDDVPASNSTGGNPAPVTAGLPVVGPSWITAQFIYSASTKRLDIEMAGDVAQLRFARTDGVAFVGSNPDGVALASGTFYGAGDLFNQGAFIRQWAFGASAAVGSGIPAVPLTLTFRKVSDGTEFNVQFTPTDGPRQPLVQPAPTSSSPVGTADTTDRSNAVESEYFDSVSGDDGGVV